MKNCCQIQAQVNCFVSFHFHNKNLWFELKPCKLAKSEPMVQGQLKD